MDDQAHNPHAIDWQPDPANPNLSTGTTGGFEFRRTYDPLLDIVSIHSRPVGSESWSLAGSISY